MASKKRHTVDSWVEATIGEVIDGKGCSAISLLHLKGIGGASEEVTTRPIEGTVNPHDLAENLIGRAEGFSQDLPGLNTFKLIAFYGSNEAHNPFHFTTSDGSLMSRSETVMSAHEPTPTGVLGQQMKHIEALIAQNNQLVTANMTTANAIITMCFGPSGLVRESIQSQLEAVAVVKDAMLDMHRERKALIIEESKAAQDLQMRKAVIDFIPKIANRLTGREIIDEKSNRAEILEMIAEKISPQDLDLFVAMGKITKEQALVLSAQFAAIVEEKRKESEALSQVPSEEIVSQKQLTTKGNGGLQ
jgi:hypothetical protein